MRLVRISHPEQELQRQTRTRTDTPTLCHMIIVEWGCRCKTRILSQITSTQAMFLEGGQRGTSSAPRARCLTRCPTSGGWCGSRTSGSLWWSQLWSTRTQFFVRNTGLSNQAQFNMDKYKWPLWTDNKDQIVSSPPSTFDRGIARLTGQSHITIIHPGQIWESPKSQRRFVPSPTMCDNIWRRSLASGQLWCTAVQVWGVQGHLWLCCGWCSSALAGSVLTSKRPWRTSDCTVCGWCRKCSSIYSSTSVFIIGLTQEWQDPHGFNFKVSPSTIISPCHTALHQRELKLERSTANAENRHQIKSHTFSTLPIFSRSFFRHHYQSKGKSCLPRHLFHSGEKKCLSLSQNGTELVWQHANNAGKRT